MTMCISKLLRFTVFFIFTLPLVTIGQENKIIVNHESHFIEQVPRSTASDATNITVADSSKSVEDTLKISINTNYSPYRNLGYRLSKRIKSGEWDDIDTHHFRHNYFFYYHVFTHQHLYVNQIVSFKN